MIVLDTNVISELTKLAPDSRVVSWVDEFASDDVATTAITAAELLYGVARLPEWRRKRELGSAIAGLLRDDFEGRILAFDEKAARCYAEIVTRREWIGRPIGTADAEIAAICQAVEATLATRNTGDFEETGILLVNPWT